MKVLTQEEEAEHNKKVWQGGSLGAVGGLAIGSLGVWAASKRFHAFAQLSLPFRAFLVTGSTSFGGVITADRYSRAFEASRHADSGYVNKSESLAQQAASSQTATQRIKTFVSEQRYPIVFGSWVAGMGIAFALVGRNPYLTGQQKLVQARVYAQGLTLAVLVASFALEGNDLRAGKGRWETIKIVDPDDPEGKKMIEKKIHHEKYTGEDQWMDMLDSQEERMKKKGHSVRDGDDKGKKKKDDQQNQQQDDEGAKSKSNNSQGQNTEKKQEGKSEKKAEAKSS